MADSQQDSITILPELKGCVPGGGSMGRWSGDGGRGEGRDGEGQLPLLQQDKVVQERTMQVKKSTSQLD